MSTAFFLSLWASGWGVLATLPVALPTGLWLARHNSAKTPLTTVVMALVYLPLVLPPVATGYGLLLVFGHQGLNLGLAFTWQGAAVAAGVMAFPLVTHAIRLSAQGVDPGLVEAARTLGATPARTLTSITLPLMLPGILSGLFLGFARALGEFGATITFAGNIPGETQTLPLALYNALQHPEGDRLALHLCALSLFLALLTLGGAEFFQRALQHKRQP